MRNQPETHGLSCYRAAMEGYGTDYRLNPLDSYKWLINNKPILLNYLPTPQSFFNWYKYPQAEIEQIGTFKDFKFSIMFIQGPGRGLAKDVVRIERSFIIEPNDAIYKTLWGGDL